MRAGAVGVASAGVASASSSWLAKGAPALHHPCPGHSGAAPPLRRPPANATPQRCAPPACWRCDRGARASRVGRSEYSLLPLPGLSQQPASSATPAVRKLSSGRRAARLIPRVLRQASQSEPATKIKASVIASGRPIAGFHTSAVNSECSAHAAAGCAPLVSAEAEKSRARKASISRQSAARRETTATAAALHARRRAVPGRRCGLPLLLPIQARHG
jgi:hypothetical protein